jgi:hypothetical protein
MRLLCLLALVGLAGCRDGRCEVDRRMNCTALDAVQLDERYTSCQNCDAEVSPVFQEMGDCFSGCVALALEYQCPVNQTFWDDSCALECTGESSVASAALRLIEMESHRRTLSTCIGG